MTDNTLANAETAPATQALMETLIGLEPTSGFQEMMGYRIVEWREGFAALEMDITPRHLNRAGVLHGGVAASLLDTVCGFSGCYCPDPDRVRKAVTLSLTTQYLGQATAGTLRAISRVRGGGRKIFFCAGEVFGPDGTLIAAGEGTFRYRSGSEDSLGSPRK